MSVDWLVQEHTEADKSTNATYRIGIAEGLHRAKSIPPSGISADQAHQVAMIAAYETARGLADVTPFDEIGSAIAKAYLQAYEAVEGWTKPTLPQAQCTVPFSGHMVMFRYGDSITVQCSKTKKTASVTLHDRGTVDFMLPKDA